MMKRIISLFSSAAVVAAALSGYVPPSVNADNPIVQTVYTSDPAPMVYNDTFYMYTGHDADGSDYYTMPDWKCYSSTDMQNWTDHGTILADSDFDWAEPDTAWAAQCIERNGKFYMYVTLVPAATGGRAIGVAVSDSPTGPFKDALGKPLCGPNWDYIDPTVFIDDDGQAYLYFGNPNPYYVKLNEDMISCSGDIVKVNMTEEGFGTKTSGEGRMYTEGPWIYKRGDLYYLLYAANGIPENIAYSTAPTATGPWTYRGVIMPSEGRSFTNHCGVVDYMGRSYFAYHNGALEGGSGFTRSVAVEEFKYNPDGTFPTIKMSKDGPEQLHSLDPFVRNEAETICWESGIETEKCSSGGMNIANIENGDYVKVKGVDFGEGADTFTASVASATSGGTIEIYADSLSGKLIGSCDVPSTDGWQTWQEVSCSVDVSGEHDLYFKFTGGSGFLFNVDWWKFGGSGNTSEPDENGYFFRDTFESGIGNWSGRGAASVSISADNSFEGSKALLAQERTASWNGATKPLGSVFKPGEKFSFSANVMYKSGKDTDTFFMKLQYTDENGDTQYSSIAEGTAVKGEWIQLANTSYKIPEGATDLYLYIETENSTNSFYADDVIGAQEGVIIKGAEPAKRIIPGDVNCDGVINSLDMALARKGLTNGFKNMYHQLAADADQSGEFEVNDAVLIQEFILGKIKEFPVNAPEPPVSDFEYEANLRYHDMPASYKSDCEQKGTVEKITTGSTYANVYLPYGYDANDKSKQYNIFYLMHGGGENQDTIFSNDVKFKTILDNMIMNGDIEPMIVVTPTFNDCGAENFHKQLVENVIKPVEGKYNTYAKSTSDADLKASRMHRAYGGFSMGGLTTWYTFMNCLDYIGYYMPLSGDNWAGNTADQKAQVTADAAKKAGYSNREYFIFAATGTEDIAYEALNGQVQSMKKLTDQFVYTSDFSEGNFYFLTCPGATHWWGAVVHYIYDGLPYFFHEQ